MTLHLNASESVSQKILSFLESLTKQGESVEIIDDSIYKYEKAGVLKGLEQIENGDIYSSEEILEKLNKEI
jgi:predicted ABC-type transport system involved in lysophospholipase L1 biosynthesis ATPase subunit